ncbi:hypothetical protein LCGC14_1284410 [marine sediment metagenome]|uniref:Uncharacterized protein n=1 Tax=marine sediment metagenome TaxID=412755 RepID=A0A0F9NAX3_9ZZZZ
MGWILDENTALSDEEAVEVYKRISARLLKKPNYVSMLRLMYVRLIIRTLQDLRRRKHHENETD